MSSTFPHVVVAYDFSTSARPALDRAVAIVARAPLHVLDIVCIVSPHSTIPAVPGPQVDFAYTEQVHAQLTTVVEDSLRDANPNIRVHFNIHVRIGKPAQEILAVARSVSADLIVIGTKGATGLERIVLGSVAEQVVREAGCAVIVARPKAYPPVELLDIETVERTGHYTAPHRYYYEDNRVLLRPTNWPMY